MVGSAYFGETGETQEHQKQHWKNRHPTQHPPHLTPLPACALYLHPRTLKTDTPGARILHSSPERRSGEPRGVLQSLVQAASTDPGAFGRALKDANNSDSCRPGYVLKKPRQRCQVSPPPCMGGEPSIRRTSSVVLGARVEGAWQPRWFLADLAWGPTALEPQLGPGARGFQSGLGAAADFHGGRARSEVFQAGRAASLKAQNH